MNRHLREAKRLVSDAGATIVATGHGRHIELTIEKQGVRGILRIHQGGTVHHRHERGLRSQIRRVLEGIAAAKRGR